MHIETRNPTLEEYAALRQQVGWWSIQPEATQKGLEASLFAVVALDGGRAVGLGRVVGDGGLYYYIQDLMVAPSHQGQGLGRKMLRLLIDYIKANAPKGAFIGLMAAKGLEGYYREFGFQPRAADAPGMFMVLD